MGFNEIMQICAHIYFCILQINVAQKMGPKVVPNGQLFLKEKSLWKRTNGSKDGAQSSAKMDNFSPKKNLFEKIHFLDYY